MPRTHSARTVEAMKRRREPLPDNHWLELAGCIEYQGRASLGIDCFRISLRIARTLQAARADARAKQARAKEACDAVRTDDEADVIWKQYVSSLQIHFRNTAHVVGWLIGLRIGLILAVKSDGFASGAQEREFALHMADFFRSELQAPEAAQHMIQKLDAAYTAWVRKKNPSEVVHALSGGMAYRAIAMARAKGSQARDFIAMQTELRGFVRGARQVL